MKNYSYYQVQTFIKIIISQIGKFQSKIKFISEGKDTTEEFIMDIINSSKYFVYNNFSRILLQKNMDDMDDNNYIELLSKIYDYDLSNLRYDLPLIYIQTEKLSFRHIYIGQKESKKKKNYNLKKLKKLKTKLKI